ncbi:MAG: hypothetical protein IJ572_02875 [Bacilli bacterium]|nr:hypothetical protein [Bacilli bacterium]
MSLKEELIKFRTRITGNTEEDSMITPISLDDKVDEFIDWYFKNMVKGNYTDIGEYHFPREMRDLIEKIAVWYELRYPSYEINRLMPGSGQEQINVNDVMFRNNPYVNELLDENSDAKELDWDEFYNTNVFIKSLPWEERCYFSNPIYNDVVYLNPNSRTAHLHLTKNGFVEMAEDVTSYTYYEIKDEELTGLNVRDVVKLFKDKGIELPENNELEKAIKEADKWIQQKEGILDCAMYRIIERGGNRIGPRRAFVFAKEFGRSIDIPMMYAVDFSDPGLRLFMNEYIKAGGSKDLKCYVGYFSRASKNEKVYTTTIQDLILTQNNNAATFYTPEEHELHQRIVNAIASQVDHESVRQEEVKQLRLERKLEKSRNRQQ